LAGFSFGAYVAAAAHTRVNPERLMLVAPPVDMYPQLHTIQIETPDWLLIQGEQDEIVAAQSVHNWAALQAHPPQRVFIADSGHFFHGKLNQVKDGVLKHWAT
jgi:hypothetical protein